MAELTKDQVRETLDAGGVIMHRHPTIEGLKLYLFIDQEEGVRVKVEFDEMPSTEEFLKLQANVEEYTYEILKDAQDGWELPSPAKAADIRSYWEDEE